MIADDRPTDDSWRHPSPVKFARAASRFGRSLEIFERFGLIAVFGVVVLVFSLLRPETFPTVANWQAIATTESAPAILCIALLPPLVCGRFDVSSGANMATCSIVAAALMGHAAPVGVAILAAILVGAAIGLFNGVLVAYLGVNSIVGTLATATILGGLATGYTGGAPIASGISNTFLELSVESVFGVPDLMLIALIIAVFGWFVLVRTVFGRELAAIGVNLSAARLTGLPVKRLVLSSFVVGGALAGAAGVVLLSLIGNGNPDGASLTEVVPSLAATFLGATTWRPGRYNVLGTMIALFFIGATTSGLALTVPSAPWVTDVFNGAVVIAAVVSFGQIRRRRVGLLEVGD